jgi:hypothetical protein
MTKITKVYCESSPLYPAEFIRDKQAQLIETKIEEELRTFLLKLNTLIQDAAALGWSAVGTKLPDLGGIMVRFVALLRTELEDLGYTLETYEGNTVRISW